MFSNESSASSSEVFCFLAFVEPRKVKKSSSSEESPSSSSSPPALSFFEFEPYTSSIALATRPCRSMNEADAFSIRLAFQCAVFSPSSLSSSISRSEAVLPLLFLFLAAPKKLSPSFSSSSSSSDELEPEDDEDASLDSICAKSSRVIALEFLKSCRPAELRLSSKPEEICCKSRTSWMPSAWLSSSSSSLLSPSSLSLSSLSLSMSLSGSLSMSSVRVKLTSGRLMYMASLSNMTLPMLAIGA
mmetsp:Transcript_2355/g.5434  ORF Transcript_2355/g.5434 Transcript_2355/m.5434 type:complete len:244 (+) Transcript_2355:3449-4180(+)